jgi:DNA-3-methyladenine glycosylase
MEALGRKFFERPPLEAARVLLGKHLCVRQPDGGLRGGRIVEVEAYCGPTDKASHARLVRRGGRLVPTDRSAVMFGPAGHAYVYLIYGMHNCMNVVTHLPGPEGVGAVLLRALEPVAALEPPAEASLRGPARLCAALGIDRRHNGIDLTSSGAPIFIADGPEVADAEVHAGPRIGVEYAAEDALLPYRLCVSASRHLSRPVVLPATRPATHPGAQLGVDSAPPSKRQRTC